MASDKFGINVYGLNTPASRWNIENIIISIFMAVVFFVIGTKRKIKTKQDIKNLEKLKEELKNKNIAKNEKKALLIK